MNNIKFELLKLKYVKILEMDQKFFSAMMEKTQDPNEKIREIANVVLEPKNESDLMLAEAFRRYYHSMMKLYKGMAHEDMEDNNLGENYGVMIYIAMIKAVVEGRSDADTYWNQLTPDNKARAVYWTILATKQNPNGMSVYIGEKVGKKFNYSTAFSEYNEYLKSLGISFKDPANEVDANDEKSVRDFVLYTQELENLIKNGKVHHNAEIANIVNGIRNIVRK